MSIFKCKMCGGDLNVTGNEKVVECEYCGSKQTVPSADDDKKVNLFNRANRLRISCEFDKAAGIYENIIAEFPGEAEAYWGLCLCNYGIEYVDDPATAKKIPTCHRASFDKMRKDENYELALENADISARIVYEEQAKEIDRIMGDILSVSRDEKPYDIFICYKETDNNGARTPDSVLAQDIYDALTAKGYRVFFSRITLEDKLGTQYEPYIFSALNSAKIMLAVGTDYEYFNAVWVKNEWSRFIKLAAKDKTKVLIPCYKDMDPYDMPNEFKGFQAQDCAKLGFMQDLTRGIEKIFGRTEKSVERVVVQQSASTAPLLKRAFMALEDGEWEKADNFCEQVLNQDPENAQAYLGKLMAELHVNKQDNLKNCAKPFDDSNNYQKAVKFGDDDLPQYIAYINERNENSEKEYQKKIDDIARAIIGHNSMLSFEKRKEQLQSEIDLLEKKKIEFPIKAERISVAKEEISTLSSQRDSLISSKSNLGIFKKKEKQEIDERISEVNKKLNKLQNELKTLESEIEEYKSVSDIEMLIGEKQNELEKLIADLTLCSDLSISYEDAIKELSGNDSLRSDVFAAYPKIIWIFAKVRGYCEFGKYHQTASGKDSTPIQWRVLAKENNRVLIISEKALDCQPYNTSKSDVTWKSCSLREWMNGTFLNNAFSADEQAQIQNTTVSADKNPKYDTNPGNATTDKVFLLSITEAKKYFTTDEARKCAPTAFAKAQGAYTSDSYKTASGEATCWWWLRSPGSNPDSAAGVLRDGSVSCIGNYVNRDDFCVRPALWINIGE